MKRTGGGVGERHRELLAKDYKVARSGVSNYTLDKKSRIVFLQKIPDDTDDIISTKDIPSWKRMCCCILKNDHLCRSMGFGLSKRERERIAFLKNEYRVTEEW